MSHCVSSHAIEEFEELKEQPLPSGEFLNSSKRDQDDPSQDIPTERPTNEEPVNVKGGITVSF